MPMSACVFCIAEWTATPHHTSGHHQHEPKHTHTSSMWGGGMGVVSVCHNKTPWMARQITNVCSDGRSHPLGLNWGGPDTYNPDQRAARTPGNRGHGRVNPIDETRTTAHRMVSLVEIWARVNWGARNSWRNAVNNYAHSSLNVIISGVLRVRPRV